MLTVDEIREYWEGRASGDSSSQSTTNDVYLREIELRTLIGLISEIKPAAVVDIGCGDGRTTLGIAEKLPGINFAGYDYSTTMIENARQNLACKEFGNVLFGQHDILQPIDGQFCLAFTTRCLINLPDWQHQRVALRNIHSALKAGGHYLMIENFIEGHDNFNKLRKDFGLSEISVRDHNLFFNRDRLLDDIDEFFSIEKEINISSTYYMVSRVIYSRICADNGSQPDYFDMHHRYSASLPFLGEFGPVRLLVLKKR